jgi:hypothetical protein
LVLPDIPFSDELRSNLCAILPAIKQCQEDRNRLLHNRIVQGEHEALVVLRSDKKGSHAHVITINEISSWAKEAADLAASGECPLDLLVDPFPVAGMQSLQEGVIV